MKRSLLYPLLMVILAFAVIQAQTIWTQRSEGPQIRLEVLRPSVKSSSGVDFSSTIVTVDGRIPVVKGIFVQVEVPYSSESVSSPFFSDSKSKLGNPYVGVEVGSEGFPVYGELGFRPMVQTSSSPSFGSIYGDFERAEAYLEDLTTYQFALNFGSREKQGFVYRIKAGPTIWSPKGGGKSTTLIDYGVKAGYDNGTISVFAGLTGRDNTEVKSGKAAYNFLAIDAGYRVDKFRPALFVRLPLDKEVSDIIPQTSEEMSASNSEVARTRHIIA